MKGWQLILALLLPLCGIAQQHKNDVQPGTVQVILSNPYIDSLMAATKLQAEKDPIIKGFRVQVMAAGNRADVNKAKGQFYGMFPDIKTFVIYQQPNFKLRVGNFRSKTEAYKAWKEITKYFPGAFITPDEIKMSEL